jgi:predicted component of type VI protein secretion system
VRGSRAANPNSEAGELSMNLILEVVARDGQPSGPQLRKVFGVEGGRIGRAADCEWMLLSPYISRYHANVFCIDDVFYVVSTGENGVALNNTEAFLPKLEHQALQNGDRLFIDEYEIAVAVELGSPVATAPVDAQRDIASEALLATTARSLRTVFGLDPLRNVATPAEPAARPQVREAAWNHSSGLEDHFAPPPLPSLQVPLPADWDNTNPADAAARKDNTGARPSGSSNDTFDLSILLRGAGIEPASLSPEMAAMLGSLLRSLVQGFVQALHAYELTRAQHD